MGPPLLTGISREKSPPFPLRKRQPSQFAERLGMGVRSTKEPLRGPADWRAASSKVG